MDLDKKINTPLINKQVQQTTLDSDSDEIVYDNSMVCRSSFEELEQTSLAPGKKEDKKTNFNEEFSEFKKNTEMQLPFSMTQFEDVLYVREKTVITLQYIFYQKGHKTSLLKHQALDQIVENTKVPLIGENGKPLSTQIGVENYQQDVYQDEKGQYKILQRQEIPQMSMFNNGAKYYTDSGVDYESSRETPLMQAKTSAEDLEKMKQANEEDDRFLNEDEYNDVCTDYSLAEGLISIFKTDDGGRMIKVFETSFSTNLPFKHSQDGNMLLVQSNDHKTVSLTYFDPSEANLVSNNEKQVIKVLAWKLTDDDKLEAYSNLDTINKGLCEYYEAIKNSFVKLNEIKFIDSSKYVMMSYVEKVGKKPTYEQFSGESSMKPYFSTNNSNVKKANKFVIFDTQNGKPILEWGGCYFGINAISGQYDIYYLGLIPVLKTTGVELYFFYGGRILEFPSETNAQKHYDWTWTYLAIPLRQLINDKLKNKQFVISQIASHRQNLSFDHDGVFRMRSTQFTLSQEWQMDVSISINKSNTQFGMLNNPNSPNDYNKRVYQLYHTRASQLLENRRHVFGQTTTFGKDQFMPLQERILSKDIITRHGRNFQNKNDIYFMQIRVGGKGGTGICMKLDQFGNEQSKAHYQITLTEEEHPYSMIDIICYSKKNNEELGGEFNMDNIDVNDVIQSMYIRNGDQQLVLKTRIPSIKGSLEIIKSSKSIQLQKASYPIIAYNLGIHKLAIMNQQDHKDPKQFILELEEDESFICFVNFNKYEDFGFYPDAMRIYGCSQILYASRVGEKVHINLILFDPFFQPSQIAILRSSNFIPFKKFNCELDLIQNAVIVPTKKSEGDDNFKIYMMLQHEHLIHRSVFQSEYGDQNEEVSCDIDADRFFDGDLDDLDVPKLENVIMQQDSKGFLYYVVKANGLCKIMEVNPRESELRYHTAIFEIKCEQCMGFQLFGDTFFFIDEFKTIHVLQRILESRDLRHVKELNIKEVSLPDFQGIEFEPIVITEKYILSNGKIFYLYKDDPMPQGIYETEDQVRMEGFNKVQNVMRFKGPVEFTGSNQFFNVYKTGTFKCHMVIYEKPDSAQKTLINDFMHLVDVSTFLQDGRILVKCLRRYMIFSPDGQFIDEVNFEEIKNTQELTELQSIIQINTQNRVKAAQKLPQFDENGYEIVLEINKIKDGKPKSTIPIDLNNMRDLVQFSQNNEYFVFINRLTFQLDMYKLTSESVYEHNLIKDSLLKEMSDDGTRQKYKFIKVYNIAFEESDIFNSFKRARDANPELNIQKFIQSNVSVTVENSGDVAMMQIINQPLLKNVLVEISMFSQDNKPVKSSKSIVKNFNQEVDFHPTIEQQLKLVLEEKKTELREQISVIKIRLARLPKSLQDFSSITLIEDKIKALDYKIKNNLIQGQVIGSLAVVWCGNQLKFSKICKCRLQKFERLEVDFCNSVEIQRVLGTLEDHILQIVATDNDIKIFIVMTWDFNDNLEVTMYQTPVESENQAHFVVQGMYQKLNYYLNKDFVYDLEFSLPLHANTFQSVVGFQSVVHQHQCIVKWANQRKIFKDTTQFLDVEAPYILNSTQTRMEMLFWDNFRVKTENIKVLQQCMKIHQWSIMFRGQSLWHHYAGNAEMIQFIHDKFLMMKAEGLLTSFESRIPLMLLQPDKSGFSALYHSIQQDSPKSFELMVHILKDFDNICISKMILKSLPTILAHESPKVIEFFESSIYQNLTMQTPIMIPWPEGLDEFVFPCNSSIISQNLVMQQMGTQQPEKIIDPISNKISKDDIIRLYEEMLLMQEEQREKEQAMVQKKSQLTKKVFNISFINNDDNKIDRVEVVAHEFDWMFEENNLQNLLAILNEQANPECLTTVGIKVFVKYIWREHYQQAIVYWIFFPYMVYLILMTFICSGAIKSYLDEVQLRNQAIFDGNDYTIDSSVKFLAHVSTTATICFFIMFVALEASSFISDGPRAYFSQTWNCIDFLSICLNFTFLSISCLSQIKEAWVIDEHNLLLIGAYATFFMWCKMFYWMRLFESTAFYVTLIVKTIADCMTFMLMILIVLLAFGSFFMVINQNMQGREDGSVYVNEYLGIKLVDALISTYFMGLGEFDYDGFSQGPNKFSAWSMFLIATFLTCVIFMSMLIAIMGETFGDVTRNAEQNILKEQISLINDHIWLLDLKKTFKNQKYLIIVKKAASDETSEKQVGDIIQNLEKNLSLKNDRLHNIMMRRMETLDNLTRALFKNQKDQSVKMQKLVSVVRTSEHTLNDLSRQIKQISGRK